MTLLNFIYLIFLILFLQSRVTGFLRTALQEDPRASALAKEVSLRLKDSPRSLSYPSQPLGYDRYGNAYWMLTVQEANTLFPVQPNGSCIFLGPNNPSGASASSGASGAAGGVTSGKVPLEPCVLMRATDGWWGFHGMGELPSLLASFATDVACERILLLKLIEKAAYTRCMLYNNALYVKVLQREWVVKRVRSEHAIHNVRMPNDLSPIMLTRLLETVWGRCAEVRQMVHYASVYRIEEDPTSVNTTRAEKEAIMRKQKKVRDMTTDDTFENHQYNGWERIDSFARIRQISCTTSATRIVADPGNYAVMHLNLKRSPFLNRNDPQAPPVAVSRSGAAGISEEAEAASAVAATDTNDCSGVQLMRP